MATPRRILASSGGFLSTGLWGVVRPGGVMLRALDLTGVTRPRVCFVLTASGDDPAYLSMMYSAMADVGCDVDHLALFPQPNRSPVDAPTAADVIWVGGGSVANLLALWRLHGVDEAMHEAWAAGTVLAGVSAGSICWHEGGPTDSFGRELQLAGNGLGFLPYGNAVHYDSEEQRRPLTHRLVASGDLPVTYATDDRVGILYEGTDPIEVVSDDEQAYPDAAAYRVEAIGGEVSETRLPVGPLR